MHLIAVMVLDIHCTNFHSLLVSLLRVGPPPICFSIAPNRQLKVVCPAMLSVRKGTWPFTYFRIATDKGKPGPLHTMSQD